MLRPRPIPDDVPLRVYWNQDDEYTRDSEYEYSEAEAESVQELRQVREVNVRDRLTLNEAQPSSRG